jgi:hypothetical protein
MAGGQAARAGEYRSTTRLTYRMQGDQLVLTDDQGKQMSYSRAELLEFQ